MAVLRLAAIAAAGIGCYSPDAPDCTLACTMDSDCIASQRCTTDHLCATAITTCGNHDDAGHITEQDAGSGVTLTILVQGGGGVRTSNGDFCDGNGDADMTCMFALTAGEAVMLTPMPHIARQFDKWQGPPCMAQPFVCSATANGPLSAMAKFK